MSNRTAAVAGTFYPIDKDTLRHDILSFISQVKTIADITNTDKAIPLSHNSKTKLGVLKALIVPHAGYIYSGLTAAFAYHALKDDSQEKSKATPKIKRVILLGPSHHVALRGMAVPDVTTFSTPLGKIPLDTTEITHLINTNQVLSSDLVHEKEHSLEVQLPFLQVILESFKLLPIVVGQVSAEAVAQLLQAYMDDEENLIVISTDLSHFLNYDQAQKQDQQTNHKIINFIYDQFEHNDACGSFPLAGMLKLAKKNNLSIHQLDLRNSGDTAGDKQRVVGYGAWSLYAKP